MYLIGQSMPINHLLLRIKKSLRRTTFWLQSCEKSLQLKQHVCFCCSLMFSGRASSGQFHHFSLGKGKQSIQTIINLYNCRCDVDMMVGQESLINSETDPEPVLPLDPASESVTRENVADEANLWHVQTFR